MLPNLNAVITLHIHIHKITTLCILNLHSGMYQLYLNEAEKNSKPVLSSRGLQKQMVCRSLLTPILKLWPLDPLHQNHLGLGVTKLQRI